MDLYTSPSIIPTIKLSYQVQFEPKKPLQQGAVGECLPLTETEERSGTPESLISPSYSQLLGGA